MTGETLMLDKDRGRRFLDHYGTRGLRVAFERYGLIAAIERRGFTDIQLETRVATDRQQLLHELFEKGLIDAQGNIIP